MGMSFNRGQYEAACLDAAEHQGLVPVLEALTIAGIPHTLDQTGGFVMTVTIRDLDTVFVVTADDVGIDDHFVLGYYTATEWDEGDAEDNDIEYGLRLEQVIAKIQEGLQA